MTMELVLEVVGFGLFLVVYSFVLSHVLPKRYYSLVNLLVSLGGVVYAVWLGGLSFAALGLASDDLGSGLVTGCLGAGLVIAVVIGLSYKHSLRKLFMDEPEREPGVKAALSTLVWRIPFGTALSEEVLFRGVLLGLLLSRSEAAAVIISSVLFGLWHIAPTIRNFQKSPGLQRLIDSNARFHGHIVVTVLATAAAGAAFALLRIWTGSLLTTWLIHAAINGASVAVGYWWLRQTRHASRSSR
jgi:membrane protease YdiL (CAAX protease family)